MASALSRAKRASRIPTENDNARDRYYCTSGDDPLFEMWITSTAGVAGHRPPAIGYLRNVGTISGDGGEGFHRMEWHGGMASA